MAEPICCCKSCCVAQSMLGYLRMRTICKIQGAEGRHALLESPWTSSAWDQKVLTEFLQRSLAVRLAQCMFGLKHPENQDPLQKRTRIQTTSKGMFQPLDIRTCSHDHVHSQIAGTCKWKDHRIRVSKFAGFYPRTHMRFKI